MPPVGFEPTRTKALVPKTSMSTSSITEAFLYIKEQTYACVASICFAPSHMLATQA